MFYTESELRSLGLKAFGRNVKVSSKASLYNCAKIEIGDFSRIDDFCVISAGKGGIHIGRFVHVAVFCSLIGAERIELQDFSGLSARVGIYTSNEDYSGAVMTNPTVPPTFKNVEDAPVIVGRHVIIGAGSIVLPGVTFHEGAMVGAMSLVKDDCETFGKYIGVPAKRIGRRARDLLEKEKELEASLRPSDSRT